jgi:hypothetical protein
MSTLAFAGSTYLVLALATGGAAILHALRAPRRRGESLDAFDRMLLVLTGVTVGALWIVFAPVYLAGWSRERLPKHVAALRARLRRPRRAAAEEALPPAAPAGGPTRASR